MQYTSAFNFLTISPDDVNNPTMFRLSIRSLSNHGFPAVVDDEFFKALQENSHIVQEHDIKIPTKHIDRLKAACKNPVATSIEFMNMMEAVFCTLLGLPPYFFTFAI